MQDLSSLNSDGVKVVFENKQGELIALNLSDENYSSLQKISVLIRIMLLEMMVV